MDARPLLTKVAILATMAGMSLASEPFTECPSQAFLFQQSPVQIYGVDLLTGQYELLQNDSGMVGNINGVGFSFVDRFLYGFNTTTYEVVRLNKDLKASVLNVSGLPANTTFYVGDVSQNYYWLYRKNVGLYKIHLDDSAADYLQAQKLTNADVSLTLTDFAFHPENDGLYAVDNRSGFLYRLSTLDGQAQLMGDTGVTGTFGAGYFDVDGYYYISRNSDGKIFRIDLSNPYTNEVSAVFFAQGPFSSQNDGARCAYAPIVSANVDWGDAPDSYGTLLASNGPRHSIDQTIRLGVEWTDGEISADVYPSSDDLNLYDDEDGVTWQGDWVAGLHQQIEIDVHGGGYVHAWVDWNGDGQFQATAEQVFKNYWLADGQHIIPILIPIDAAPGESWLRIRISSQQDLLPTGGAVDGEVEDHQINISLQPLTTLYYPSQQGWVTLAFEDQWPSEGDYDFNDAVLNYRLTETWLAEQLQRVDVDIQVKALGASYRSGFAVHLPAVDRAQLVASQAIVNFKQQPRFTTQLLHSSTSTLQISKDLLSLTPVSCPFFNTTLACADDAINTYRASLILPSQASINSWPSFPYDPMLTGVEGFWRGVRLANTVKEQVEIHLPDISNSPNADTSLWQSEADDSQPDIGRFYKTQRNLPWALLLANDWQHPKEGVSLLAAYPLFADWAESGGQLAQDWFVGENANSELLF